MPKQLVIRAESQEGDMDKDTHSIFNYELRTTNYELPRCGLIMVLCK